MIGRADTVIDRLYLAGVAAHPGGGGVHGASGANAARAALSRNTIPGYAPLIRTAHHLLHHQRRE